MKRVLVLAGGGIRGVMQLETLRFIESYYAKPIYQIYDMIVGTSVGAITGGILATGIVDMKIYSEKFLKLIPMIFETNVLKSTGLVGAKYDRENFYKMWRSYYEQELFMKDCKTRFVCTAVNLCNNKTHLFCSWDPIEGEYSLPETITKSFAAPYYFGAIKDEKNKAVWIDGGVGEANCPLDWAYTQSVQLGWDKEELELTVIGTGEADRSITYDDVKSSSDIEQMLKYMDPNRGGLARIQSTMDQIDRLQILADSNSLLHLIVFQTEIDSKYEFIDKEEYVDQYLYYGKLLATKVAHYFNELEHADVNLKKVKTPKAHKHPFSIGNAENNNELIVIYLDLFSAQLNSSLLMKNIIQFIKYKQRENPQFTFSLFFFKEGGVPFLSEEMSNLKDIEKIFKMDWQNRDLQESNLENGLFYCLGYFTLHTQKINCNFRILLLSDLPSNWPSSFMMSIFDWINRMKKSPPVIDIIRIGKKHLFIDDEKLQKLTEISKGRLIYVESQKEIFNNYQEIRIF